MRHFQSASCLAPLALLLVAAGALAAKKPSAWDLKADAGKADYIYLEAGRQRAVDNNDAFFDLLSAARRLNPDDKLIKFDHGFYTMVVNGNDSAAVADGYAQMRDYFDTHPEDLFNSITYARVSASIGRADNARLVWKRLHDIFPDNTELTQSCAEALFNSPDSLERRRGFALYDSIEAAEGKDLHITNLKVSRYIDMGDTLSAYRELSDLLDAYPRNSQVIAYAGDVRLALDDKQGAAREYMRACAADSTDGYPFYALANYYKMVGDSVAYNREIVQALRKKSLDLDTKIRILTSFIQNNLSDADFDPADDMGAEADTVDILAADSIAPQYLADDAKAARAQAKIDELFAVLIEEYPHEAELYNFYASYLLNIPDYAGAAEQMSRSLDIEPANEQRWLALVGIEMQLNDVGGVIADVTRARRYYPDNPNLAIMLTAAYNQMERYDDALKEARLALELADSADLEMLSQIQGMIGDIYYAIGKKQEAFERYDKAVELNPENLSALNNSAYYLACEDRDLDRALQMIKHVVEKRSDDPTSLDTYAWVLFKLKRYADALPFIDKVLQLLPDDELNGEELDHAGDIYFMNGRRDEALDFWRRAARLDPDNDLIKRKIRNKTIFFE